LKINKSTFDLPLFNTPYPKPCRPRHIVIQVLLCCNDSLASPWRWLRAGNNPSFCVRRTLDLKQRKLLATSSRKTNERAGPLEQSPMCARWSARVLVRHLFCSDGRSAQSAHATTLLRRCLAVRNW
jgi:hypothetical protein